MVSKSLLIAAMATSLGQFVQATNTELPPCVDKFEPFTSVGCFSEANPPALIFRSQADQGDMTVEKCTAICKGNGFRYAGLKYYGVCYCGAAVESEKTDDGKCNLPCSGDKTETCGGNDALSVWEDPTFTKTPAEVPESSYVAQGCFTDNSPGRALTWRNAVDGATLTPSTCIAACNAQGFPYAGTEYGGECYCGTFLAKSSTKTADSECNVACRGDASKKCGGPNRLNVYLAKDLLSTEPCEPETPITTTSSTVVPTSTSTSSKEEQTTTTSKEEPTTTTSKEEQTTTTSKEEPTTTTTSKEETTTTSKEEETTTTSKEEQTTTTSKEEQTTTTSKEEQTTTTSEVTPTSTSSVPGTTTPPITTSITPTTTKQPPTTLTSSSICVTTTVIPPKCERQIGKWCAPPLPEWNNKIECLLASKACLLKVPTCFLSAGLKDAFKCFEYAKYCEGIKICCIKCGLGHCKKGNCDACKPNNPPPTTVTKTVPCTTAPTTTTTPTVCPPAPTNICKEGFPGKPLCDIPLPIVSCNDEKASFDSNPFKLYDNVETTKCWKFPKPSLNSACSKACQQQYNACADAGLWKCAFQHKRNAIDSAAVAEVAANQSPNEDALQPRTFNLLWKIKCKAQLVACLKVNKWVDPKEKCKKWCPKDD